MKAIRNDEKAFDLAHNCLMCGRCEEVCPVGIEMSSIRMIQRREGDTEGEIRNMWNGYYRKTKPVPQEKRAEAPSYTFLPERKTEKADVIYFAGCMSHLTPGIKNSMMKIFRAAGEKVFFMDKEGGVCCGRPLMLAGQEKEARELINFNSEVIWKSGARTLVTSCPICYKVFRESYYLDAEVLHHSQYIKRLIDDGAVRMNYSRKKVVYHDPCELGRGSGVYDEPRAVLSHVADLQKTDYDSADSLCCGGSLGNIKLSQEDRNKITKDAVTKLTAGNPDIIATSCPLCKKTFSKISETRVEDIAEIVASEISDVQKKKSKSSVLNIRELVNISLQ
jgi:Fe-S oxidoreductase